ncbi:hypothetical protein Bca101_025049 [Brassica carinata]
MLPGVLQQLNRIHDRSVLDVSIQVRNWTANLKLILFSFDQGPLFPIPLSLTHFICFTCFPIKLQQNPKIQGHFSKSNFVTKHEILLTLVKLLVTVAIGCNLEPNFNEPYLATSLQDFWSHRWNLMVPALLKPAIYIPVRRLCNGRLSSDHARRSQLVLRVTWSLHCRGSSCEEDEFGAEVEDESDGFTTSDGRQMRNGLGKASSVYKSDDEASDDDKPVIGWLRVSSNQLTRLFPVRRSNVIRPQVDSDGKVHMTSSSTVQTQTQTSMGASSCKPVHNEQKRPLVNNIKLNYGLKLKTEVQKRTSSSNQSSAKRPKLSEPAMEQGSRNAATPDSRGKKNMEAFKRLRVNQVTVKEDNSDGDDHVPIASRIKQSSVKKPNASKMIASSSRTIAKNKRVMKDFKPIPFRRDGQKKWTTLEHNGVIFPPPYKCHGVKIIYQGKPVDLTPEQEEVATMFAKMRETEYYNKPLFRENFWNDWGELLGKEHVIRNLDDCDFSPIYEWYMQDKETRKQMSAEMGKLRKRIRPCDITINIGKDAPIPECPIPGERWKEVKHDNTVTWLAFWNDPINPKEFKYVFLAASSALKGQRDKEKYEKARKLKGLGAAPCTKDLSNKDATRRETEVATYLIDKLSLRARDEKVAIVSDHDQRTVSESYGPQVEKLAVKIEELREQIEELDIDLDRTEEGTVATELMSDFFIVEPVKATDSSVPVFTEPATQLAEVLASEGPKETAISPEVEPILYINFIQ